jgi:indole-3-glycerol phosphate synthase
MTGTFLDRILDLKREKVGRQIESSDAATLKSRALEIRSHCEKHRLRDALSGTGSNNIIAEIKRSSPSKGVINDTINVAEMAAAYEQGGAAAISVLTEEDFFRGSLDDLIAAKNAVRIPILRKDFIVDEFQIYESAAAGADIILLIAAALSNEVLGRFLDIAGGELGMDAIVEVHTAQELQIAASINANIIGVNNRDLKTFDISLDISRDLITKRPRGALMIAESGLSSRSDIDELGQLGFDGFLIGEALMKTIDPAETLRQWK